MEFAALAEGTVRVMDTLGHALAERVACMDAAVLALGTGAAIEAAAGNAAAGVAADESAGAGGVA